jgi:hypothetical protein
MIIGRSLASAALSASMALAWVPATQTPAIGGEASVDPSASPWLPPRAEGKASGVDRPAEVWLRGPFGRVAGGSPAQPATASPWGGALNTFVRRAPLVIETDGASAIDLLRVEARSMTGSDPPEILSTGDPTFAGPDRVGQRVLVATLVSRAGETHEAAWLVDVPDRPPPADPFLDMPAPLVIVASSAAKVAGHPGDGCYAYLCVEAGGPPAAATMAPLPVEVGEVLSLFLDDRSAITAWEGSLSPIAPTRGEPRQARGALTDTLEPIVALAGLEAPSAGAWLLVLKVVLDRERGWLATYHRLEAR